MAGCFIGDEFSYPTKEDMVEAGKRCGIPNLEPTEEAEGSILEPNVSASLPDARQKEDCIYADLKQRGFYAS
jgi:hypothetical protein